VTPSYLFTPSRQLPGPLQRKLQTCRQLILFLDFDGTLAGIRPTPAEASLSATTRKLLRSLASRSTVSIAIVTGRSLRNIRQKVDNNVIFIANHGLEIFEAGIHWVHPGAEACQSMLGELARKIRRRLRNITGAFVENKRYTISIHYRLVDRRHLGFVKAEVSGLYAPYGNALNFSEGKRVVEIGPRVRWNKGVAVQKMLPLLKTNRRAFVVYVGDDTSDESAFDALRRAGTTIVVGQKAATGARYWVKNPAEVRHFLGLLNYTMER